jgi:hypothetical protein
MKLADYLYENSMTPSQLRTMLGVKNRSTIHRYLLGERIPNPETLLKIIRLTEFKVGLADFLDSSPPDCARVIENEHGVPRIVLPWSPDYCKDDDPGSVRGGSLSRPVNRALDLLEGRAKFTPRGVFLLDGRVCDLKDIMRVANAVLESKGEKPIPYPGVCPPHPDRYLSTVMRRSNRLGEEDEGGGAPS